MDRGDETLSIGTLSVSESLLWAWENAIYCQKLADLRAKMAELADLRPHLGRNFCVYSTIISGRKAATALKFFQHHQITYSYPSKQFRVFLSYGWPRMALSSNLPCQIQTFVGASRGLFWGVEMARGQSGRNRPAGACHRLAPTAVLQRSWPHTPPNNNIMVYNYAK